MTCWALKTTLQRQHGCAGLYCTIAGRSSPSKLSRPLSFLDSTIAMSSGWTSNIEVQSNLYKWSRSWSSKNQNEPMLHLSLSVCTSYWLLLALSSRHWCLPTGRPQAPHPSTSTPSPESPTPSEDCGASSGSWYHHSAEQNHYQEWFHLLFLAGGMIFPTLSGQPNLWQYSRNSGKLL